MAEFDVIARYFTRNKHAAQAASGIDLGIGDDAALLRVNVGHQLVVSADMSVSGAHFFADANPFDIGWKAMAVNVSDMAAMGAQPKWATLSIALPTLDAAWLEGFSDGLFACADSFQVALIGGDTTRGSLNISITILGEVPVGQALRRDTAQAGDDIWVSGCLGNAALWLQAKLGKLTLTEQEMQAWSLRMHRPQPRVELGLALRGIAHSALDISDGLLSDLGHVLDASKVGAQLDWLQIPQPEHRVTKIASGTLQHAVLAGGDDYELCFTAPVAQRAALQALAVSLQLPLTRIGSITAQPGLQVLDGEQSIGLTQHGYDHFG